MPSNLCHDARVFFFYRALRVESIDRSRCAASAFFDDFVGALPRATPISTFMHLNDSTLSLRGRLSITVHAMARTMVSAKRWCTLGRVVIRLSLPLTISLGNFLPFFEHHGRCRWRGCGVLLLPGCCSSSLCLCFFYSRNVLKRLWRRVLPTLSLDTEVVYIFLFDVLLT